MPASSPNAVRLSRILNDVERLRPLPASLYRLLRALDAPENSLSQIAGLISLDQAMAAEVLRLANTVALGYRTPCSSVIDAVVRLGLQRVRTVVLAAAASARLAARLLGYGLSAENLWHHSVVTATLAMQAALALNYPDGDEAYVAGLLHDIGKLVLDQYVRVDYQAMLALKAQHELQAWQVEERLLGMDHGAVGGLIALKWQFPRPLLEAIRCHHWPSFADTRPELAALVNVANVVALELAPTGNGLDNPNLHPASLEVLKLTTSRWVELQQHLRQAHLPAETGRVPHA